MKLKVIAFDADDTLWDNEIYFQEAEKKFFELLKEYLPPYHVTWGHEKIDLKTEHVHSEHKNFKQVETIKEILQYL